MLSNSSLAIMTDEESKARGSIQATFATFATVAGVIGRMVPITLKADRFNCYISPSIAAKCVGMTSRSL